GGVGLTQRVAASRDQEPRLRPADLGEGRPAARLLPIRGSGGGCTRPPLRDRRGDGRAHPPGDRSARSLSKALGILIADPRGRGGARQGERREIRTTGCITNCQIRPPIRPRKLRWNRTSKTSRGPALPLHVAVPPSTRIGRFSQEMPMPAGAWMTIVTSGGLAIGWDRTTSR